MTASRASLLGALSFLTHNIIHHLNDYNNEKRNKDWFEEGNDEKNVSETELAGRLGISNSYLNAVSCGKKNVTITQLERIAEALGMTLHICFEQVG